MTRLMQLLRELWTQKLCLLIGHDGTRTARDGEVFLVCSRCWRRSPGVRLVGGPALKYQGDPARHVLRRDPVCQGPAVAFVVPDPVGRLDDPTATLAADLMGHGQDDLVQLLLADDDGHVH